MTTLANLARDLDATTDEVASFGNLSDPRPDSVVSTEDAGAIREAWGEVEAKPAKRPTIAWLGWRS